jgi:hypothetical protein
MQFYSFLYQDISHSIKSKTVESMYRITQQRKKMNNGVLFRLLGYVLRLYHFITGLWYSQHATMKCTAFVKWSWINMDKKMVHNYSVPNKMHGKVEWSFQCTWTDAVRLWNGVTQWKKKNVTCLTVLSHYSRSGNTKNYPTIARLRAIERWQNLCITKVTQHDINC